jgi:uncharacterized protein with HEPN domain
MERQNDTNYLCHINDSIGYITTYTTGLNKTIFLKNRLVQDGVIRQLEIIGEAVKNLSSKLKHKHAQVPWKSIAGSRDILIHQYMGVDLNSVWDTVKKDIPKLEKEIQKILNND